MQAVILQDVVDVAQDMLQSQGHLQPSRNPPTNNFQSKAKYSIYKKSTQSEGNKDKYNRQTRLECMKDRFSAHQQCQSCRLSQINTILHSTQKCKHKTEIFGISIIKLYGM